MKLREIHSSILPVVRNEIYQEPLKSFFESILPQTNFQPKEEEIFKVFKMPLNKIRVVILGTEPITTISNKEIFKITYNKVDISSWEGQGIFLLNTALTVETGNSGSHLSYWRTFTENIIRYISYNNPCIWFLWGKVPRSFQGNIYRPFLVEGYNQSLIKDIPVNKQYNYVFRANSFLNEEAFLGCKHFYQANVILEKLKETKIDW